MKTTKIFLPFVALALTFGLVACNQGQGGGGNSSSGAPASSVPQKETIKVTDANGKSSGELEIEKTLQLTPSVEGVTWKSADEKIATVSDAGLVTAVAAGEVKIKASKDGYFDGSYTLTVKRAPALATLHFEAAEHLAADGWWGTADDGYSPVYARTDGNASDQQCIAHFDNGDKETLTFTSSAAIKGELVITMASSNGVEDMSAVMSAKFNNVAIDLAGKALEGGSSSEFLDFSLGEKDIIAGDNVLELSFLSSSAPYIDDLAIYSKQQANIQVKAAPEKQRIVAAVETLDVNIGGDPVQIALTTPTSLDGVEFISDKEDVASVNAQGQVSGLKFGTAVITIKKNGWYSARISATVDKAKEPGEIRVQAEDAAEIPEGFHSYTDRTTGIQNGHYGGAYITGYDVSSACSLSYTFTSPSAQQMKLIIAGASHYQMDTDFVFGQDCTIKLNNNVVQANQDAKIESNQVMGAPTVEVEIGIVSVKQGENTFVLEFAERAPALDAYRFIPVQVA